MIKGILLLALVAMNGVFAQAADQPASPEQSCRQFVKGFYDWYIPKAASARWDRVLPQKPEVLSHEMVQALKGDLAASAKSKDEIVGLDFDPFLNTQDPAKSYALGKVEVSGKTCSVEIFSPASPRNAKPDLRGKLLLTGEQWRFVDFQYDESSAGSLMSLLRKMRDDRRDAAHKSTQRH